MLGLRRDGASITCAETCNNVFQQSDSQSPLALLESADQRLVPVYSRSSAITPLFVAVSKAHLHSKAMKRSLMIYVSSEVTNACEFYVIVDEQQKKGLLLVPKGCKQA